MVIVGGLAVLIYEVITHPPDEQTRRRGSFYANMSDLVVVPQWLPRPLDIVRADLKGKWLARVNLRFANAVFANLRAADLQAANLQEANLQGAELSEAKLTSVHRALRAELGRHYFQLSSANLQGANLQEANLQGADLRGANLKKVRGLTEQQIQGAQIDEHTKLPPDLKTPRPAAPDAAAPPREGTAPNE